MLAQPMQAGQPPKTSSGEATEHVRPLVSVCMPVLNGGDLVFRAVRSALEQDYPNVELIVVDDASTDGTAGALHAGFGKQIKLVRNAARRGHGRTLNTAIAHSRGAFLKFLDHDDYLHQGCIAAMMGPMLRWPSVGIAFSRHRLEVEPGMELGPEWQAEIDAPQQKFADAPPFSEGDVLLSQLIANGLQTNWLGEPSSVLVRRSGLAAVGGFNVHTRQTTDLDLWVRILTRYDATFVHNELCTYRWSGNSLTMRNRAAGLAWLDRLWMLESLMWFPAVLARHPELARMRAQERHMAWRTAVRGALVRQHTPAAPKIWTEYAVYRLRSRFSAVAPFEWPVRS